MRSAMQAAVPAPKNLMPAEGTTSVGFTTTIFISGIGTQMETFALNPRFLWLHIFDLC